MTRFLFFIFASICFSTTVCYSQSDSISTKTDSSFYFPIVLKTTPLTLIDIVNGGSAVIIAESFPAKQISVSMELGAYYRFGGYGMRHLHGWRSGMELRYYFNENPDYDYFFGLRYFYKKIGFEITDSIKIDLTQGAYARTYNVTKDVNVIDFVFGTRNFTPLKKNITEFYFGLGVRFKNTSCSQLSSLEADHRQYGDSFIFPILMENGSYTHLDFLFGIKIGIGFRKGQ